MTFSQIVQELRRRAGLSQQDVADTIGIARATYIKLENGGREPKLDELRAISKYYEISVQDLVDGKIDNNYFVEKIHFRQVEEIVPRDINPKTNYEKLREVLLYILGKVGAKPNVGETVLYRLLYFIDFDYYEKTGQSITGLTYIRNHFGPTPARDFMSVIKAMKTNKELDVIETPYFKNKLKKYLPLKNVGVGSLRADELRHIDETLQRLSDKSANELSELSHYDTPWLTAKDGQPIDYRGVFYRTRITAVTEPDDEL